MAKDRPLDRPHRRPWPVAIAVALALAGTLAAAWGVHQASQERLAFHFDRTAANLEQQGRQRLRQELDVLADVRDAIDAGGLQTRAAFASFARAQMARHAGIRALEWVPEVPLAERPAYEAAARRDGLAGFRFTERGPEGRLVAAAARPVYYPVFFVEPMAGNEAALGFAPVMRERDEAIAKARETGQPAASQAFEIVQGRPGTLGVAVFVPVYQPPGRLRSLVEGVVQPDQALGGLQAEAAAMGIQVSLVDLSAPPGARVLLGQEPAPGELRRETAIDMGTRQWSLAFTLQDDHELGGPRGLAWVIFLAGLAATTLLGGTLWSLQARRAAAEALAAERARALEQARALDAMKTNFVNGVAHDLRTPLTAILGYAEFLEDDLPAGQHPYVEQIIRGARRLERLMDDLLDLARVDAGLLELRRAPADLGAVLRDVAEGVRPLVAEAGVALELAPPAGPLEGRMDVARIERVLFNLVHNAIKFTPAGGTIRLACRRRDGELCCEVQDGGPGIPEAERPRLFQRFSQLEPGRQKGGAGLGLSIAKAIVEAHGGEVGVGDGPAGGAVFWFTLPGGAA